MHVGETEENMVPKTASRGEMTIGKNPVEQEQKGFIPQDAGTEKKNSSTKKEEQKQSLNILRGG